MRSLHRKFSVCILLLFTTAIFAQNPPPPFGDDVNDEFPIDNYEVLLCVIALIFGYSIIKKSFKKQTKNTRN